MGPIAAAVASSLAGKLFGGSGGGGGQQFQPVSFPRRMKIPIMPEQPWNLRGTIEPRHIPLVDESPIRAAFDEAAPEPEDKSKTGSTSFKDAFLQSLTQGLVQRMLFGGQQPGYQYQLPTFGR